MCIQELLLTLNGLDIMVTIRVYFEYIRIPCKIFTHVLRPYNKFIQTILLYFLKILQMRCVIIIIIILLLCYSIILSLDSLYIYIINEIKMIMPTEMIQRTNLFILKIMLLNF
jgi:hypothetical protein